MLLTIITFILVLGVLVFVHELGHFLAARSRGVRVEEFGFGFPPRMFGIKRGETIYSINWIPLGGFVKIYGEKGEGKEDKSSFANRGILERAFMISAGVLMNILLAFVILSAGYSFGLPAALEDISGGRVRDAQIRVVSVLPDSPASEAGLLFGDIILSINDKSFAAIPELQEYLKTKTDQPVALKIKRGEELISQQAVPRVLTETKAPGIGVGLVSVGIVSYPIHQAIIKGAQSTLFYTTEILKALYSLIKSLIFRAGVGVELSGPVGVAVMTGYAARMGFSYLLQFVALLSINLAVVNFLPIPALDGGRILFLLLEAIRRKAIKEKIENSIHNLGFILLLALVAIITYRDILRWGGKIVEVVKKGVGL